jgi:hypothetical protein
VLQPQRARSIALLASLFAFVFVTVFGIVSLVVAPQRSRAAPNEQKPELDSKAMEALARSAAYLRGLPAFALRAEVMRDEVVHDDFKLQRTSNVQISVRRPDRLRAELSGDLGDRLFIYDGKSLGVYLRGENYYGSVAAPATLRETLDVFEQNAIDLPLVDMVFVAMGGRLGPNIQDAGEVGVSLLDGVPCTQLAFRGKNVDWQLWVEQGDRPVPRKLVITTNDEPTRPQYTAIMRWDVSTPQIEDSFKFTPPSGTLRMTFASAESAPAPTNANKAKSSNSVR